MCVNYITVSRQLCMEFFRTPLETTEDWRDELYQDYRGPIIVHDVHGRRRLVVASYGFIPQSQLAPGQRMTTMNARSETVADLRSYRGAWHNCRLCLVPMQAFFEPNYESGRAERWAISMADHEPFAVAGLYRTWLEPDGSRSRSFTQLTINADDHPLMRRFHKPDDEKRSLVVIRREDYDAWLGCRAPELARTFLQAYPAPLMAAEAAPRETEASPQGLLF